MAIYNKESMIADEFINHQEILDTIKYAEENKRNVELIDSILEKAKRLSLQMESRLTAKVLHTERHRFCLLVTYRKKMRKCTGWQKKLSRLFMAIEL